MSVKGIGGMRPTVSYIPVKDPSGYYYTEEMRHQLELEQRAKHTDALTLWQWIKLSIRRK